MAGVNCFCRRAQSDQPDESTEACSFIPFEMTTETGSVTLKRWASASRSIADFGFGRDDDVFVDDRATDAAMLADDDVLHEDRFPHIRMVLDANVREKGRSFGPARRR